MNSKQEALDCTLWRTRFGREYGPLYGRTYQYNMDRFMAEHISIISLDEVMENLTFMMINTRIQALI